VPRPSHQARAADWAAPARRSESADWAGALDESLARRRTGAWTRSALGGLRRGSGLGFAHALGDSALCCGLWPSRLGSSKKIGPAPRAMAQAAMGLGPPLNDSTYQLPLLSLSAAK
jgi:hypothetical protein